MYLNYKKIIQNNKKIYFVFCLFSQIFERFFTGKSVIKMWNNIRENLAKNDYKIFWVKMNLSFQIEREIIEREIEREINLINTIEIE